MIHIWWLSPEKLFVTIPSTVTMHTENVYGYSFFPSAVRLWNMVPPDIAMLPTLDAFKGSITAVPF